MKSYTGKRDKACDGGGTLKGRQKALELDKEDVQLPVPQTSPLTSCALMTWCHLQTRSMGCRKTRPKAWEGSLPTHYYLSTAIPFDLPQSLLAEVREEDQVVEHLLHAKVW